MLGIVGALEAEVEALIGQLAGDVTHRRQGGIDLHQGQLAGVDVVIARSGVGKVNAALAAAALAAQGATEIVFTGVAGGLAPGLSVGDVVVATDLVQHDVDVTALGRPAGELLGEPGSWSTAEYLRAEVLACARAAVGDAQVIEGRIASGDQFVADPQRTAWIRQQFDAVAVEMEGAALAQACSHLQVDCAVIRVISDGADSDAVEDFPAFLRLAARTGQRVIEELLRRRTVSART